MRRGSVFYPPVRLGAVSVLVAALAVLLVATSTVARPPPTHPVAAPVWASLEMNAGTTPTGPPAADPVGPTAGPPHHGEAMPGSRVGRMAGPRLGRPAASVLAALDTWSSFVATADPGVLDAAFVPSGPQHAQLIAEAPGLAQRRGVASPEFSVRGTRLVSETPGKIIVDAHIAINGAYPVRWRFHLRGSDGAFRVWTIEDVTTRKPPRRPF